MDERKANEISKHFMETINPTLWNGKEDTKPDGLQTTVFTDDDEIKIGNNAYNTEIELNVDNAKPATIPSK